MRALVAEENAITRVMLRTILERAAFEVEEAHDELGAACLALQPTSPSLAILALDTVLVDFKEICATLREARADVFIVALVPEGRRHEALTVLEAGADDFMIKPSVIQEAEARLRVVRRLLEARGTLASSTAPAAAPARAFTARPREAPPLPEPLNLEGDFFSDAGLFTEADFVQAFLSVFRRLGVGAAVELDPTLAAPDPHFSAWGALLLHRGRDAFWCNLQLDVERTPAVRLFRTIMKYPPGIDADVLNLLRQIMNLAQDAPWHPPHAERQVAAYVPTPPVACLSARIPPDLASSRKARRRRYGLRLGEDLRLLLTLSAQPIRIEERPVVHLKRFDVLASPIQTKSGTTLLGEGIMLDDTYIGKMRHYAEELPAQVLVFRPPTGVSVFLDAR